MTRSLVVWGCSSGAGKSWLATALCRLALRRGIRVAPFKAQDMSNNARVVPRATGGAPDGDAALGEIGAAQYFQALAARALPSTDMNPVLLKLESDTRSQVVVSGVVDPRLSQRPWRERSSSLAVAARAGFQRLRQLPGAVLFDAEGQALGWQQGRVLGVYAHGLFEDLSVLRALFGASVPTLDATFDRLADHVEAALDPALRRQWLGA